MPFPKRSQEHPLVVVHVDVEVLDDGTVVAMLHLHHRMEVAVVLDDPSVRSHPSMWAIASLCHLYLHYLCHSVPVVVARIVERWKVRLP
jgi:hypothetical protein